MTDSITKDTAISANEFHGLIFEAKEALGITRDEDTKAAELALVGDYSKENEITMRVIAYLADDIAPLIGNFNCKIIKYQHDEFDRIVAIEWGEKCRKCEPCDEFCDVCSGLKYTPESLVTTDIGGRIIKKRRVR